MPLINCEVNLILIWSENCVLTDITTQAAVPVQGNNPPRQAINAPTGASFKIKETKLHVPVVSLSIPDDNKLFQQLPSVEIKDFDLLIDDKSFFHTPIKNKEETMRKLLEWAGIMTIQQGIYQTIMDIIWWSNYVLYHGKTRRNNFWIFTRYSNCCLIQFSYWIYKNGNSKDSKFIKWCW